MSFLIDSGTQPTGMTSSPPNESQKKCNTPDTLYCATKGHVVSSKSDDNKDNADGKRFGKSAGNRTTTENSTKATKNAPEKIKVHMVAVGSAPILKKAKFLMNADDRFAVAISFLRRVLKLSSRAGAGAASSLFLYVNAAFVPSPDERLGDLFDCFGTRGELVVHYSLQEAWG